MSEYRRYLYEREASCLALILFMEYVNMTRKVVGHFSWHRAKVARSNASIDQILAGEDSIFNMTKHPSLDVEKSIPVRLQTNYIGRLRLN